MMKHLHPNRGVQYCALFALMCIASTITGCLWRNSSGIERLVPLVPGEWTQFGGDWQIRGSNIENASGARGIKLINQDVQIGDFSLDADISAEGPFAEAGVIFRSSGEEMGVNSYHGYFAGMRSVDRGAELIRSDFGSSLIAQAPLASDGSLVNSFHLHVTAMGCRLIATITTSDGQSSTLSAEPLDCIRRGHIGFRSSSGTASWKNIRMTAPQPGANVVASSTEQAVDNGLPDAPLLQSTNQYLATLREDVVRHKLPEGVQAITNFVMKPGRYPNVTLLGTVISVPPFTVIDDGTGALVLPDSDPGVHLKQGDEVEVKGTLISKSFMVSMEDIRTRILWSALPAPPLAVSALQLTSGQYRARSIVIQGILVSANRLSDSCELILRDQSQLYRAVVIGSAFQSTDSLQNSCDIGAGSRLRLRGVATSFPKYTKNIYPFAVIASGIDVISPPPWWSKQHIAFLLIGLLVLAMIVQWTIYRLQQWHLKSILAEREEIAFDMHDTLAQSFTGIAYQLEAASMESSGLEATREHVLDTLQTVKRSHREASNTIAALRPQNRDANSILITLYTAAERMSRGGDVTITSEMKGTPVAMPIQITDAIFRIGQEAIANALRHSHCKTLQISLSFSKRDVCFRVVDDGDGFDYKHTTHGLGLDGMRARAKKLGASLEMKKTVPHGTTVEVIAPLPIAGGFFVNLRRTFRMVEALRQHEAHFDGGLRQKDRAS